MAILNVPLAPGKYVVPAAELAAIRARAARVIPTEAVACYEPTPADLADYYHILESEEMERAAILADYHQELGDEAEILRREREIELHNRESGGWYRAGFWTDAS